MYSFVLGALLFFTTSIVALIITYYVNVLLNEKHVDPEPYLNATIATNVLLLINYINDVVSSTLYTVVDKTLTFANNWYTQLMLLLRVGSILLIMYTIHTQTELFLETSDSIWRCSVQPFFQNVLLSIFQVFRILFDAFVPLYNYYVLILGQLTQGSFAIAVKCDIVVLFDSIRLFLRIFINLFESVGDFVSLGNSTNNVFVNEFNITQVISTSQALIVNQENTMGCVCEELRPVFDVLFVFFKQIYAPKTLNHLVNVFVSLMQEFIQLIPPFTKFPNFNKPVYHLNGMLYEAGKYLDAVTIQIIDKTIAIFDAKKIPLPDTFLFSVMSRFFMAIVHLGHTVIRSLLHLYIPIPTFTLDSTYMMETFSIKQAVSEFNIGISQLSDLVLHVSNFMAQNGGILPEGYTLSTDPLARDFAIVEGTILIMPDLIRYGGLTLLNSVYIVYELLLEVLFRGLIFQEDRVWVIIQKYDGLKYPSNIITCEIRKEATWDMTNKECKCDISEYPPFYPGPYRNTDKPYGELLYDPYCGQPNLQANVFSNIELLAKNMGVEPFVGLVLEIVKASIKFVLNIDTIVSNTYFDYPMNCGYGVSNEVLQKKWLDLGKTIDECSHTGTMKLYKNDPVVIALNDYTTTVSYLGQFDTWYDYSDHVCVPTEELLRYYDCMMQRNTKSTCTEDKNQCTCPISTVEKSSCQCIHSFPDREQELAENGFSNEIINNLHKNQNLCNSFLLEPVFEYTNKIFAFVGNFFERFGGTCDTKTLDITDAIVESTTTNKCKIYYDDNVLCGISLSFRSLTRFVINELRDITMGFFNILSGDIDITLDFSNRFCDLERSISSISGMIASLFDTDNTKVIAKVIYEITVLPVKGLEFLDNIFTFILQAIKNELTTDSFYNLLIKELNIVFDWLIDLVDAMEDLTTDFISPNAAKVFNTIKSALQTVKGVFTQAALEFAGFAVKIYFDILDIMKDPTKGFDELFTDLESFFGYLSKIISQVAFKYFKNILTLLGPVGPFIDNMYEQLSKGIKEVGKGIESTAEDAWNDLKSLFGRRRLRASGFSECDLVMHHYIEKEWDNIPFRDKIFIHSCLDQKEMAKKIGLYFNVDLPEDIIYNWKRKYILLFEFATALNVYLSNSPDQMLIELKRQNIDSAWIETIQWMSNKITLDNINDNIKYILDVTPTEYKTGYVKHIIGMYDTTVSLEKNTRTHRRKLYREIPTFVHEVSKNTNISLDFHVPKLYNQIPIYKKRLKSAGLDSSILQCTDESTVCLNCVILDDFFNTVINEGQRMSDYYTKTYVPIIIPDFVHWYEDKGKEFGLWTKNVVDMMDKATSHLDHVQKRRSLSATRERTLTNFERAEKDWNYLWTNFEFRNTNVFSILKQFFEITDSSYVPYFAYSLPYYVSYPITEACPIDIIYCSYQDEYINKTTTSQRIKSIDNAFYYILYFVVVVFVLDLFSSLPILSTTSPYFFLIIPSIYLFVVYRYTYTCFPNIPNCLVDDMFAYINDVLFPNCFCHYFPGLSKTCSPESCFLCSQQTPFYSCRKQIVLLDQMGYFWAPTMYLRVHFPETMRFLYKTIPFSWILRKIDGVGDILLNEVGEIDLDCMNIHTLDIGLVFVVFLGSTYILSIIIPLAIRYIQYGIQIVTMFFLSAANMSVSIELSTISGVKKHS